MSQQKNMRKLLETLNEGIYSFNPKNRPNFGDQWNDSDLLKREIEDMKAAGLGREQARVSAGMNFEDETNEFPDERDMQAALDSVYGPELGEEHDPTDPHYSEFEPGGDAVEVEFGDELEEEDFEHAPYDYGREDDGVHAIKGYNPSVHDYKGRAEGTGRHLRVVNNYGDNPMVKEHHTPKALMREYRKMIAEEKKKAAKKEKCESQEKWDPKRDKKHRPSLMSKN